MGEIINAGADRGRVPPTREEVAAGMPDSFISRGVKLGLEPQVIGTSIEDAVRDGDVEAVHAYDPSIPPEIVKQEVDEVVIDETIIHAAYLALGNTVDTDASPTINYIF